MLLVSSLVMYNTHVDIHVAILSLFVARYLIDNHTSGSVTFLGPENATTSDSEVWTVKKYE